MQRRRRWRILRCSAGGDRCGDAARGAHGGGCDAAPAKTGAVTQHATAMAEAATRRAAMTVEAAMQHAAMTTGAAMQRRSAGTLRYSSGDGHGGSWKRSAQRRRKLLCSARRQRRSFNASTAELQCGQDGASMQPLPTVRPPPSVRWLCLSLC